MPVTEVDKSIVHVCPAATLLAAEATVVVKTGVMYTVERDSAAPAAVEEEARAAAEVDAVETVFAHVSMMHCCITWLSTYWLFDLVGVRLST